MKRERIWYIITNLVVLVVMGLMYITVCNVRAEIAGLQPPSSIVSNNSEDEIWWYQLQCALSDPNMINVSLGSMLDKQFSVGETIYLKDFDDLCLSKDDWDGGYYLSGGLVYGHILSLPPGTYYHYKNSGVMYVSASNVYSMDVAVERYYRRLRYVLETPPDIEIMAYGAGAGEYPIDVGENGSVLSFGASGCGFVGANVYIDGRTVNGLGLGVYSPVDQNFSYAGNMHNTPFNLVPLPKGYAISLHVVRNDCGVSYFKVHHCPDWW